MRVADLERGYISGDFILDHCEIVIAKGKSGYYKRHDCIATCLICGRKRAFTSGAFINGKCTRHKNCGKDEIEKFSKKHPEFYQVFLKLRSRACVAKRKLERGQYKFSYMKDELETWAKSYDSIKYYINFYDYFHEDWLEAEEKFKGKVLYPWLRVPKDGITKGNLEFSIKPNIRMNINSKGDVWQGVNNSGQVYIARSLYWLCKAMGWNYTAIHNSLDRKWNVENNPVSTSSGTLLKVGTYDTEVLGLANGVICIEVSKPIRFKSSESFSDISSLDGHRYGRIKAEFTKEGLSANSSSGGDNIVTDTSIQQ